MEDTIAKALENWFWVLGTNVYSILSISWPMFLSKLVKLPRVPPWSCTPSMLEKLLEQNSITTKNLGLGSIFFFLCDVFKSAAISGILQCFLLVPLKNEPIATIAVFS